MFQKQSRAWKVTLYIILFFVFLVTVVISKAYYNQKRNTQAIHEDLRRIEKELPIGIKKVFELEELGVDTELPNDVLSSENTETDDRRTELKDKLRRDNPELYNLFLASLKDGENIPFSEKFWEIYPKDEEEWTTSDETLLSEELERNREFVELIELVAKYGLFEYELEWAKGYEMLIPHLAPMRTFSKILSAQAYFEGEDGNPDRALELCERILDIGNHLENEPFLLSQLVRVAIASIATQGRLQQLTLTSEFSEVHYPRLNWTVELQ